MVRHSRNVCCAAATPYCAGGGNTEQTMAVQAITDDERQSTHGH
jgi:hypothetical protein